MWLQEGDKINNRPSCPQKRWTMAKILYGTSWISEDEPCLALFEIHEQSPGSYGFHRYQIIYVMRGDKPAEYRQDMGLVKDGWTGVDSIRIPGGAYVKSEDKYYIVHTVGECREMADELRTRSTWDKKELAQLDKYNV